MLWPRPLQWAWNMQPIVKLVPKPEQLCVLGRFPSIRACKPAHRSADHDWVKRVHEPNEPKHHYGHGLQDLKFITSLQCTYVMCLYHLNACLLVEISLVLCQLPIACNLVILTFLLCRSPLQGELIPLFPSSLVPIEKNKIKRLAVFM
jgi:hypothetical protein